MWLGNYFQGKKVKGQGHQAALRTAALTHQPVAAVTVRMYWPWEPTATLRSAGSVGSAARGASAPTEGGEGRGILWRPPTYSLLNGNSMRTNSKKRSEATQTLHAGYSKAEPKNFAPPQTPFPRAHDRQNSISWGWLLPSPTDPVWWRSMHTISSYRLSVCL